MTRMRRAAMANARSSATAPVLALLLAAAFLGCAAPARAWGTKPHSWITRAALDALGSDHVLLRHLGPNAGLLPAYCQIADWRRGLISQEGGESFYADDYLLFPAMPSHLEHDHPDVEGTYRPYFRRVVQALRTESPANAARWIGSLLHFVEDSGSPPHAFQTHGDLHVRMENWVERERIILEGYRPRSFGDTDQAALDGFLRRMDGLTAYSRERGRALRPLAEAGHRAEAEPIELESALECSRVVADLLETLGQLLLARPDRAATLRGEVASVPAPGLESLPAKVMLVGTDCSTLSDRSGSFELRGLPPGEYRTIVVRPGSGSLERRLMIGAGETRVERFVLPASDPPGNLLRNGDFRLHWAEPRGADHWYRVAKDGATSWESEPVPVQPGRRYRLVVRWKAGARGDASLLWCSRPPSAYPLDPGIRVDHNYGDPMTAEPPLVAGEQERTGVAPVGARYALVVVRVPGPPEACCAGVALDPEP